MYLYYSDIHRITNELIMYNKNLYFINRVISNNFRFSKCALHKIEKKWK